MVTKLVLQVKFMLKMMERSKLLVLEMMVMMDIKLGKEMMILIRLMMLVKGLETWMSVSLPCHPLRD